MKIKTARGTYYLYLPLSLYNDLMNLPESKNIDKHFLLFLVHLIRRKKFKNKDNILEWVPLSSLILHKYDFELGSVKYTYNHHREFLIKHGIIEVKPHARNIKGISNHCMEYKINENYFCSPENSKEVNLTGTRIYRAIERKEKARKIIANRKSGHLTKWIGKFQIDTENALRYVQQSYYKNEDRIKREIRITATMEFNTLSYMRQGNDDRLHHQFTRLPKDLKQFVTFQGKRIVGYDLKSSQPFMLSYLLEMIMNLYRLHSTKSSGRFQTILCKGISGIINLYITKERSVSSYKANDISIINKDIDINSICIAITTILFDLKQPIDKESINSFIFLIRGKDFYDYCGEKLLQLGYIQHVGNIFNCELYCYKSKRVRSIEFASLRKAAKKIALNALYSPAGTNVKVLQAFKALFPEVFRIIDAIKTVPVQDIAAAKGNKQFAVLLQRIEAKFVLDYVTKRIARKYPYIPLITIHDSIATSEEYGTLLQSEFKQLSRQYFRTEVIIDEDLWNRC